MTPADEKKMTEGVKWLGLSPSELRASIWKEWDLQGEEWWASHRKNWIEPVLGKGPLALHSLSSLGAHLESTTKEKTFHSWATLGLPLIGLWEVVEKALAEMGDGDQLVLPGRDAWPFYTIAKGLPALASRVIYLPTLNSSTGSSAGPWNDPYKRALLEEAGVKETDFFLDSGYSGSVFNGIGTTMGWKKLKGMLFQTASGASRTNHNGYINAFYPNHATPDGTNIENYPKYHQRATLMVQFDDGAVLDKVLNFSTFLTKVGKGKKVVSAWVAQPFSIKEEFKKAAALTYHLVRKSFVVNNAFALKLQLGIAPDSWPSTPAASRWFAEQQLILPTWEEKEAA